MPRQAKLDADYRNFRYAYVSIVPNGVSSDNMIEIKDRTSIILDPFTLTLYLVDHSPYDTYALLVEADGQHFFYSVDFRGHGRKGKLFDCLVSYPPNDIDVLLMEGSILGRSGLDDKYPSESEIRTALMIRSHLCIGSSLCFSY